MCTGPIVPRLLIFAVPLILSSNLQLLFNAADVVVVGKYAGDNSLGAVGSVGPLINLMVAAFMGLSIGSNVVASRYYGSGNEKQLSKTVHTSMLVALVSGVILAVSSMWGQTGASCEALYSASKGAVDSYVKALAKELGPSGIRVNAVSPGAVATDMMKGYTEDDISVLCDDTPLGRMGNPEEIAETLYFLQSDKAAFITGQIVGVNGGYLI